MTLIKKIINKMRNVLLGRDEKQNVNQEIGCKVQVDEVQENATQNKKVIKEPYIEKSRSNALNFQDECNTELWFKDN